MKILTFLAALCLIIATASCKQEEQTEESAPEQKNVEQVEEAEAVEDTVEVEEPDAE